MFQRERRFAVSGTEDLTKEGFIPIHKLTLDDLPKDIRTEENLQHILDMAKRVVLVNNNRLSDKRSDQMKKNGKSLKGSGVLIYSRKKGVHVLTNQHVLFNNEELERSTFDVFYDYSHGNPEDKEMLFKRCRRGDGKNCLWTCESHDVTWAEYFVKDEMLSHIEKHCSEQDCKNLWQRTQVSSSNHNACTIPTTCLISHPLGRTKHVSFGKLIDVDFFSGTLLHTAPSMPGSSGAPVIVFSNQDSNRLPPVFIYHVEVHLTTGYRLAKFRKQFHVFIQDHIASIESQKMKSDQTDHKPAELASIASTCLENASLAAFVPVFGAFLLHMEKYGLEGVDTVLFKPCKTSADAASRFSVVMEPHVRNFMQKIKQLVSRFDLGPSTSPGEEPDLASLLTPQGPCFCRSIVKLMERGVKSGDSTLTESFLSPDTTAAKMSSDSDVTWPWLNRSESDVSSVCADKEECLIKKCLQNCKGPDAIDAPIILLLMMLKANVLIFRICHQSYDTSRTSKSNEDKTQEKIIHSQPAEALPREMTSEKRSGDAMRFPRSAAKEDSKSPLPSLQEDCPTITSSILLLVWAILHFRPFHFLSPGLNNVQGALSNQAEGDDSLNTLFSRSLARSEHNTQHLQQEHPDANSPEHGDCSRKACHCGRPSFSDVLWSLILQTETLLLGETDYLGEIWEMFDTNGPEEITTKFFSSLQKEALEKQLNNPGNFILTFLDNCGHFSQGRHSILFYQASLETLLYNIRLLLRYVSMTIRNRYFAFPASVYGRPGNWPGNVTPPEVERQAWRLIQDAIMESGFPPAVLADLEEDAERRQRLIDVYVDMKQLKWQGRIQPQLFQKWLAFPRFRINSFVLPEQYLFPDATSYFAWSVCALVCPKVTFLPRSITSHETNFEPRCSIDSPSNKHLTGAEHPAEKQA